MLQYVLCVAIMIAGAIALAVTSIIDDRDAVAAAAGAEFPFVLRDGAEHCRHRRLRYRRMDGGRNAVATTPPV